jgi:hypothetical protein
MTSEDADRNDDGTSEDADRSNDGAGASEDADRSNDEAGASEDADRSNDGAGTSEDADRSEIGARRRDRLAREGPRDRREKVSRAGKGGLTGGSLCGADADRRATRFAAKRAEPSGGTQSEDVAGAPGRNTCIALSRSMYVSVYT